MKKSKFIKSTFILIIGGVITKILGMIIRILSSRVLGKTGMGIYALLSPTFMLMITLCQLGFPTAISKLVAEDRYNHKKLVLGLFPISILFNGILILAIFLLSPTLSTYLLHEKRCYYALLSMAFVLPFISISSILRGYFFGKERMVPHVLSNILEDIVRMAIIVTILPKFVNISIEAGVAFFVLSNIASELSSIFLFLFLLPKKNIHVKDFKPDKKNLKDIFSLSIPLTSSRIIGNVGYFLEPIILTSVLLAVGYTNTYIVNEYGIINGFVMPILMLPSFFATAISQALVPVISKSYSAGNKKNARLKIKQALFISGIIGFIFTIFLLLFPDFLLEFMYHTKEGSLYLKILAPIFFIQYLQGPISSSLQAMGKAKVSMNATLMGTFIRLSALLIFCFLKIGMFPILIATSLSIIVTTIYEAKKLKSFLK